MSTKITVQHDVTVEITGTPVAFCSCPDGSTKLVVRGVANFTLSRLDTALLSDELRDLAALPFDGAALDKPKV